MSARSLPQGAGTRDQTDQPDQPDPTDHTNQADDRTTAKKRCVVAADY